MQRVDIEVCRCSKLTNYIIFGWKSTIGDWKIPIAIVIVVFEIPIVNDSDSIGHPWSGAYLNSKN